MTRTRLLAASSLLLLVACDDPLAEECQALQPVASKDALELKMPGLTAGPDEKKKALDAYKAKAEAVVEKLGAVTVKEEKLKKLHEEYKKIAEDAVAAATTGAAAYKNLDGKPDDVVSAKKAAFKAIQSFEEYCGAKPRRSRGDCKAVNDSINTDVIPKPDNAAQASWFKNWVKKWEKISFSDDKVKPLAESVVARIKAFVASHEALVKAEGRASGAASKATAAGTLSADVAGKIARACKH